MQLLVLSFLAPLFTTFGLLAPPEIPKTDAPPSKKEGSLLPKKELPVRFPEVVAPPGPPSPKPTPSPTPKVDPNAVVKVGKGQYYVIASPRQLVVTQTGGDGDVQISERMPPFNLPVSAAPGWEPDPKDPEFVNWPVLDESNPKYAPYLYLVKPLKPGNVTIQTVRALNAIDETTKKPIPLTKADLVYRAVQVDLTDVAPKPTPKPEPKPDPEPEPEVPIDQALAAKFKAALKLDIAAGAGTKEKATDLATVYESSAAILDLKDPAIAPKTEGDLYTKMFNASVAKEVPRRPYLAKTRDVIDEYLGKQNPQQAFTDELRTSFKAKLIIIAAALKEASKP